MFTNAGNDNACTLTMSLGHHDVGHNSGIGIIKMTDGLVYKNKIEGLGQGTYHSHTLLLTKRHVGSLGLHFISYTQLLKPRFKCGFCLKMCKVVLHQHVLPSSEFREKAQFLKKITDMMLT